MGLKANIHCKIKSCLFLSDLALLLSKCLNFLAIFENRKKHCLKTYDLLSNFFFKFMTILVSKILVSVKEFFLIYRKRLIMNLIGLQAERNGCKIYW